MTTESSQTGKTAEQSTHSLSGGHIREAGWHGRWGEESHFIKKEMPPMCGIGWLP